LNRARRKLARVGPAVELEQGFADRLPYPDASVDRVLSSLMWHHLDAADKPQAVREIIRVLRPGGQLHLVDISGIGPIHRLLAKRAHGARLTHDAPDELLALLRQAGMTDLAASERRSFPLGRYAFYRASR
jgi:ubiquinone/menaquinone biosynthesis C-methylase UbiE